MITTGIFRITETPSIPLTRRFCQCDLAVKENSVTTLRIYDLKEHVLALDLRDLLRLLAPRSLEARWVVSTVKSSNSEHEWFEATGEAREELNRLAQVDGRLSGSDLAALADNTRQVIWGEFVGLSSSKSDKPWITIRAIDSTFYEIVSDDEQVLKKIASTYRDVRKDEAR
jgi:hypothetical protein